MLSIENFLWLTLQLLGAILTCIVLADIWKWSRMPPGPVPLPFIGNKLQLPGRRPWIKFQEWSKIYGPIFTIWVGRTPTVIISDPNIAADLMEKRSAKYSSRPRFVVMGEIYYDMASILVVPYGKNWQARRKFLNHALNAKALNNYKQRQEAESWRLAYSLLDDNQSWERAFDRFTSSVAFSVAYGHRIDSLDSQVIQQRQNIMRYVGSLNVPGAYLAETFPALRYIPNFLAPWKREVQRRGREEAAANGALLDQVREDLQNARKLGKELQPSLAHYCLLVQEKEGIDPLSERHFWNVPSSVFGAGSDTTASTMCSAMLAFVTNPKTFKIAQAELDRVVGIGRMPVFSDEEQLPYITALVKEVLRWRPVAVLGGTPHASTKDDEYQGWHFPAGTPVLGNSWAINLNEKYYPEPQTFNPARFLNFHDFRVALDLKGEAHPSKFGHSSFGWGRRICPGQGLAENSLFIALSTLIWAFNISPIEGRKYDIYNYTEGFNIRPRPFQCDITVRSDAHRRLIQKNMKEAEIILEKFPPFE
jgi:cytochrome P450